MSDIVERLRWIGSRTSWESADQQCNEAADEIERLRAANTEMRQTLTEHEAAWCKSGRQQLDQIDRLRAEVERTHDDASALISRNAELRERAEKAEAEVEALRADADYMRRLLAAAKCPTCDNSGTTPHGDECEWCYYRNLAAIDAARKA